MQFTETPFYMSHCLLLPTCRSAVSNNMKSIPDQTTGNSLSHRGAIGESAEQGPQAPGEVIIEIEAIERGDLRLHAVRDGQAEPLQNRVSGLDDVRLGGGVDLEHPELPLHDLGSGLRIVDIAVKATEAKPGAQVALTAMSTMRKTSLPGAIST